MRWYSACKTGSKKHRSTGGTLAIFIFGNFVVKADMTRWHSACKTGSKKYINTGGTLPIFLRVLVKAGMNTPPKFNKKKKKVFFVILEGN